MMTHSFPVAFIAGRRSRAALRPVSQCFLLREQPW